MTLGVTGVQLTWTTNLELRIRHHLIPLRNPTNGTCQCKNSSEQFSWNTDSTLNNTRVEVNVRVQLTLYEVRIFQCNTFEFHRQLEQGVIFQTQCDQDFFTCLLHELSAWVVVLVDTVTKAHQAYARAFIFDLLHELANLLYTTVSL